MRSGRFPTAREITGGEQLGRVNHVNLTPDARAAPALLRIISRPLLSSQVSFMDESTRVASQAGEGREKMDMHFARGGKGLDIFRVGQITMDISNAARLEALRRTELLDASAAPAFDRLTRIVRTALGVPVALISLVDEDRQFFLSEQGLAEPWASRRETPLSHSFCKHVVETEEPLVVEDAPGHALVCDNLAVEDLGVSAYLGVPLFAPDGHAIGSLCAIDTEVRNWREEDEALLSDLAAVVMSEMAARQELLEHKRSRQALEEGETRFRALQELSPDGFMLFESVRGAGGVIEDFRWLYCNRAAADIVRRSAAELQGKLMLKELPGNYEEGLFDQYRKVVETGEPWSSEFPYDHDGIDSWFRITAARAEDGFAVSFADVTRTREREQLLERQGAMLELSHDAIIVWTLEGGIETWSHGASELYGYSEAEALGQVTHELLKTQHPLPFAEIRATLERGGTWRGELVHRAKNGAELTVSSRHQLITGSDGAGRILETNRDISGRIRAEKELRALNQTLEQRVHKRTRDLERSLEELDQFAYVASHDLKAPLRAIDNLATWLAEDAEGILPESSQRHLDLMRGRIDRLEKLLDDLLAYSKADRQAYAPEPVNLPALIRDTVDLLAPPPGFEVHTDCEVTCAETVRVPLETVLRNLIANALKHNTSSEGTVTVSVKQLEQGRYVPHPGKEEPAEVGRLEFTVRDDGPGIDPRYFGKIFQIFQTLQPRDKVEGSGIGLAVVKKLVAGRGGVVDVESELGQGTSFSFDWPMYDAQAERTS